jgi:hypothetical protein
MLKAVLDTNILVSALWTPVGNASTIIELILSNKVIPCLDQQKLRAGVYLSFPYQVMFFSPTKAIAL